MQAKATRLTGFGAAARKYDVLSALALAGLEDGRLPGNRALRLLAVITTRYNWSTDSMTVGHDELARLWRVSKRTVIREIEALKTLGLLVVLEPGRKGRVTRYRLDIAGLRALADSALDRDASGIRARLDTEPTDAAPAPCSESPTDRRTVSSIWSAILDRLPPRVSGAQKARWLEPLSVEQHGTTVVVRAESAFRIAYVARTYGDLLIDAARPLGVARMNFDALEAAS